MRVYEEACLAGTKAILGALRKETSHWGTGLPVTGWRQGKSPAVDFSVIFCVMRGGKKPVLTCGRKYSEVAEL
jgi:hypothetical protein